jgi:hypothetical protein
MTSAQYDIFKKRDSELLWIEAAQDIVSAKKRIQALAMETQCQYVVYDQRTKRMVASSAVTGSVQTDDNPL